MYPKVTVMLNKFILILLVFFVDFSCAQDYIKAIKVPGDVFGITSSSKAWMSTNYVSVNSYPMSAIKTNDKIANELSANSGKKTIQVKALYDGANIAFLLKWKDKSKNIPDMNDTDVFSDGFAVQFSIVDGGELPYVDMGSKNRAVMVYLQRAINMIYKPDGNMDIYHQVSVQNQNIFGIDAQNYKEEVKKIGSKQYEKVFIAEGFGKKKEVKLDEIKSTMNMTYKNGYWFASLTRELSGKYLRLNTGTFPISFAIYNGSKKQRGRLRNLTPWIAVKLVGEDRGETLIEKLTQKIKGDITNGAKIATLNCSVCHRYKDVKIAPKYMAPDLSNIGGYCNSSYLLESIIKPSAIIVSDFTRKAHPNFPWEEVTDNNQTISTMPSFEWMSKQQLNDLVAFLQTLK